MQAWQLELSWYLYIILPTLYGYIFYKGNIRVTCWIAQHPLAFSSISHKNECEDVIWIWIAVFNEEIVTRELYGMRSWKFNKIDNTMQKSRAYTAGNNKCSWQI